MADSGDKKDGIGAGGLVVAVIVAIGLVALFAVWVGSGQEEAAESESPEGETPTSAAPEAPACVAAPAGVVDNISSGLEVQGGGGLANVQAVEVPPDLQVAEGWPEWIVAAQITGSGMDDVYGAWAVSDDGVLVYAVNTMARTFSVFGAAAADYSEADEMMDMLGDYEQTATALACAGA